MRRWISGWLSTPVISAALLLCGCSPLTVRVEDYRIEGGPQALTFVIEQGSFWRTEHFTYVSVRGERSGMRARWNKMLGGGTFLTQVVLRLPVDVMHATLSSPGLAEGVVYIWTGPGLPSAWTLGKGKVTIRNLDGTLSVAADFQIERQYPLVQPSPTFAMTGSLALKKTPLRYDRGTAANIFYPENVATTPRLLEWFALDPDLGVLVPPPRPKDNAAIE